jgi:ectoine hydroxylase
MNSTNDLFPSRAGVKATLVPRRDPVIYPQSDSAADSIPLTPTQVKDYEKNGFLVLHELFSAAEVACFKRELDRLRGDPALKDSGEVINEPGSGEVRSVFRVHAISPTFEMLASDKRLVNIARGLLGDEVYIHQSRVNFKPGLHGKEFYWHSDFETWHVEDGMPTMRALSMSITMTENTPCNGPLMVMPGSHKLYATCTGTTPANHFKESLRKQEYGVPTDDQLTELANRFGVVNATCKPGSVIIFDCNIMHGSNSNITPNPRSNAFFVYNAVSNQIGAPFCDQLPRPEYIATRQKIQPLNPRDVSVSDYCAAGIQA